MDTTFCQKRIISHASLATTLILYLVVWSSWANAAQGWLSQPSPCPRVPTLCLWDCSGTGGEEGHCWISPCPGLWSVCHRALVLGVSQQNTEALHPNADLWCSHANSLDPPLHGMLINCFTSPFAQQFHPLHTAISPRLHPPVLWARTPCQRVKTTHLGSFLLLPYQQAHYLCKEKKV